MALIKIKNIDVKKGELNPIQAKIKRRRLQILVHSFIYYKLNNNIIDDFTWNEWANELVDLQTKYPELASEVIYSDEFKDFTGETGSHFKFDAKICNIAYRLLRIEDKRRGK